MIFAEPSTWRVEAPSSRWETDGMTVVADANIDNLPEIRSAGVTLSPETSAAETIGRCYERWGLGFTRRLLGDFAYVIRDEAAKRWVCGRDHLGVRPLYFRAQGAFTAGSIARDVAGASAKPDVAGVSLFILGQYDDTERSLYENVRAVPPGHELVVDEGGQHVDAYWKINAAPLGDDLDLNGAAERFSHVFREAVRCRALEEPIAVPVSGGLDSSSVLSQASALTGQPPVALHVAFPGMGCDESHYCDALVDELGVPLFRFDARQTSLDHADDDHPDLISQPTVRFFDPLFERAARSGARTILTGIGGDHVMDESRFDCADALREGRLADLAVITGIARHPFALAGYRKLLASGLRPLLPEPVRRAARAVRPTPDFTPLTVASGTAAMEIVYARMKRAHEHGERKRAVHRELTGSTLTWPVQQANRVASRHGLRVRQPFLDLRVVELMLSVPARFRLRDGIDKHKPILRAALAELLPDAILQRTDTGEFSDFLRYILVGEQTRRLFEASRLADLGVIDDSAMRSVLRGRSQNDINRLTLATGMELWLRRTWS